MSKVGHIPVIEWSQQGVRGYDPVRGTLVEGPSVSEVLSQLGSPRKVGLALARSISFIKLVHLPDLPRPEVLRILELQASTHFPADGAQLAFDYMFIGEVESAGRPALAAAVKVDILRRAHRDLKDAGATVVWCRPTALGSHILAHQLSVFDALVMEQTPSGLALDAIHGGKLVYSRCSMGSSSPADLNTQVARTLAAAGMDSARVICADGLTYGGDHTAYDKPILDPLSTADVEMDVALPEVRHKAGEKKLQSRRSLATLTFLASLCVGAMIYMDHSEAAEKIEKEKIKWNAASKRATGNESIYGTELSVIEAKQKLLNNSFAPAQSPADVMSIVSNAVPSDVWLTGLTIQRGQPLQVLGLARNNTALNQFVGTLNSSGRFRDVLVNYANNVAIEETPAVRFSISAHVIGNFPIIDRNSQKRSAKK